MREILFRGKRLDNGEWVYGMPWIFKEKSCVCPWKEGVCKYDTGFFPVEVIPETVGQYTGLTDKNGNKIFEGDIVLGRFEFGMKVPSLVVFRDGVFGLELGNAGKNFFTAFTGFCNVTFEVIGNVFDNPELLNKEACPCGWRWCG